MSEESEQSEGMAHEPPSMGLHTIGQRLRWAIDARPPQRGPHGGQRRGIRLFQSDMEERAEELEAAGQKLLGVTLASIQSYLRDDTKPSVEFLQEAARILDVRESWLTYGQGEPTEALEAVDRAADRQELGEVSQAVFEGFYAGIGKDLERALAPAADMALWGLWADLRGLLVEFVHNSDPPGTAEDQLKVDRELARRIGAAVWAPLEFFPDDHWVSYRRWNRYVAAICGALSTLLTRDSYPDDGWPEPVDWREFLEGPGNEAKTSTEEKNDG